MDNLLNLNGGVKSRDTYRQRGFIIFILKHGCPSRLFLLVTQIFQNQVEVNKHLRQ